MKKRWVSSWSAKISHQVVDVLENFLMYLLSKAFNQQINRNIERFPVGFMFQITKEESDNLVRSHFVTSQIYATGNDGGRRYLPCAFTEQSVYMFMTF